MAFPEIINKSPGENVTGIDGNTLISFDAYDSDSNINPNTFLVYVSGNLAFSGPNTFHAPYNGPNSIITEKEIEGTTGYNIVVDYTGEYTSNTLCSVRVYVEDQTLFPIDDTWYFRTGNRIISIVPLTYEVVLDVTFEQPFTISSSSLEPANYVFTNGMYARKAEIISNTVVRLWVELFYTHEEFSLNVSSSIVDGYGKSIPQSYNNFVFYPFESLADISNFNGRIRTWRDGNVVVADDNNIYLAGTKGIDVFNKQRGRWAQIFNENKSVQSMFVANFGGTYDYSETVEPYLFDMYPSPSGVAPYNTVIMFSVGDVALAVEPTALKVYVNDVIAFNGSYGGWENGFSGFVDIQYKYLNVAIKPPVPYSSGVQVNVRVVAEDLLGNILDTVYFYTVSSGWGFLRWGRTNFGFGTTA
jgi:hypothetical protein